MIQTELLAHEATTHHRRLVVTRWVAIAILLGATVLGGSLFRLALPVVPLLILSLFIATYNTILRAVPKKTTWALYIVQIRRSIALQIGLDWLSLSAFLHLTGGINSPAMLFFLIQVIIVSILFTGVWSYFYGVLVVLTVGLVAFAEAQNIIPHYTLLDTLPDDLYQQTELIVVEMTFFGVAVMSIALLVGSIMQPLRQRARTLSTLFQTTESVSSTLDLPSVLQNLSREACLSLQARGTTIRLLDVSQRYLDLVAEYGEGYFAQERLQILPASPHEAAIVGGQTQAVTPASMANYPAELIQKETYQAMLVPIQDGRALGLLSIYFANPINATSEVRSFVRAIADQGATAISHALAHDALQKAEKQREQFVHIITHELRSPVVASQSLLRALVRRHKDDLTEQQHDILTRLSNRMDALQMLINDLLSLAETKARDMQEPLHSLEFGAVVSQVFDQYTVQAAEKGHELRLESPAKPLYVLATETGLKRIVDNLIGNAIKYTPEGGRVTVCLCEDGTLTVEDTGIGIAEDSLQKLGTEFFRASNAINSDITGTGLGLATVKQLIEHFGGQLKIDSTVNVGTKMTVTLPTVP